MHGLPRLGAAGLVRAVVHDGHAGMDGIDECPRVGQVEAVMVDEIKIHVPIRLSGQTSGISLALVRSPRSRKRNLPKRTRMPAERGFSVSSRSHLGSLAQYGVGPRLDAGNARDVVAVGGKHHDAQARQVDGVAGMNDAARRIADGLEVCGVIVARDVSVLAVHAVVQELPDLDALHQFRHAAHVVRT